MITFRQKYIKIPKFLRTFASKSSELFILKRELYVKLEVQQILVRIPPSLECSGKGGGIRKCR